MTHDRYYERTTQARQGNRQQAVAEDVGGGLALGPALDPLPVRGELLRQERLVEVDQQPDPVGPQGVGAQEYCVF